MKTVPVTKEQFPVFHRLLTDYYRDGEDAQTPQEELDGFIEMLFELRTKGAVSGCIAYEKDALGFIIYGLDTKDFPFSNKPGCGTILEIGVVPSARGSGLGRMLAKYAEEAMDCEKYYVCAYGPAESFWKKCSYRDTGEIASNGLKIFEKMRGKTDHTSRFDGKGEIYAKARPKYAAGLFEYLKNTLNIGAGSVFADVGSGTGRFAEQLLECGYKVFAVEPNGDMRRQAEEKLSRNESFVSVSGSDRNMNLPDKSVDIVCAAQAFHWVDGEACAAFSVGGDQRIWRGQHADLRPPRLHRPSAVLVVFPEGDRHRIFGVSA